MTTIQDALSILTRVAGELVRRDGIPDEDNGEFKPLGKRAVRELASKQHKRGVLIANAIEAIRKEIKTAREYRCNLCGGLVTFDGTKPGEPLP